MAYDVIVIGGGPGGSTTAALLARQGRRVLLLEREAFPREHVGESLLPATMPILEDLGVMDEVRNAGFVEKWGATMVWGASAEPWAWYFRETNLRYPHSYQVWRPQFDDILLRNARRQGVDVRERSPALEVVFEESRATAVRYRDDTGEHLVTASMIVDASGQAALINRRLRLRQWDSFFQNLAVYGYFSGARRLQGGAQGNILVEAFDSGWLWSIPLHTGWMSVGAVVDRNEGQRLIEAGSPEAFLRTQVACSRHTKALLEGATLVSQPSVLKDWSYQSRQMVGGGYILVGDAACFIDPLFSSGVHLAMSAGVLASAYVHTVLDDPTMAGPAGEVYEALYSRQYNHFRQMASLFYSSNRTMDSYFWEARRLLDQDERFTPREAFVRAVAGQPPQGYERVVLEHGAAPASFAESVREVESARARRSREAQGLLQDRGRGDPAILAARPVLATGVSAKRRPVLGDGRFEWGWVIERADRSEDTECSSFVAALLGRVDGQATVGELAAGLASQAAEPGKVLALAVDAMTILYVDGVVASLSTS